VTQRPTSSRALAFFTRVQQLGWHTAYGAKRADRRGKFGFARICEDPLRPVKMVLMAYDDALAARVRQALSGRVDAVEKPMFGGVTFMVAGNMCCGVHRNDLIIRLDRQTRVEDLGSPYARGWDFMKRPMPGMFAVAGAGCPNQKSVVRWVDLALTHALSLPPKSVHRKAPRTSKERRK
jgi:TfoX/Sxy family transcriptional regulator of competence genes